jgi:acyl-CoA thioester hydrolase
LSDKNNPIVSRDLLLGRRAIAQAADRSPRTITRWAQAGRDTGWTYRSMEDDGLALPVIEAHCDYRSSARYDDEIAITTTARLVSPVRLAFDYTVSRPADDTLIAAGHTVHATVDRTGRIVRLPARVKDLFL